MALQRTAIALAALTLAAALAGCGSPTPVPPPPTQEELDAAREAQAQSWWDSMSTGTTMPDIDVIEVLPREDAYLRQGECLEEAQLPGVRVSDPGQWSYDGSDPTDPNGDRVMVQWWICAQQFPSTDELDWMRSPRQLDWLYDYFNERYIPCLRSIGIEPVMFPSRREFLNGNGYPGWLPFPEAMDPTPRSSDWVLIAQRCPLPDMVDDYNLPGYASEP